MLTFSLMFLDKLISNSIKLFQLFFHLVNDPKTCASRRIFCCSVPNIWVHSYITSERFKLECPTSQIKDNFKGFPMVIYSVMFCKPRASDIQKRLYPFISQLIHSGHNCKFPQHLLSAHAPQCWHLQVFLLSKSKRQWICNIVIFLFLNEVTDFQS